MKAFIICALLTILVGGVVYSQTKRVGNTFKAETQESASTGTKTKYIYEDKEGNRYPIFISKNGACYIIRVSKKTGKEYKYYLPKEVQDEIKKELGI